MGERDNRYWSGELLTGNAGGTGIYKRMDLSVAVWLPQQTVIPLYPMPRCSAQGQCRHRLAHPG
jgi:hypothetical protein